MERWQFNPVGNLWYWQCVDAATKMVYVDQNNNLAL